MSEEKKITKISSSIRELTNEEMKERGYALEKTDAEVELDELKEIILDEEQDIIFTKKTSKDYKEIWKAFCEEEVDNFEEMMGYGKRTIKKIGIKKFINAMDWNDKKDISLYKTDRMHIVPCIHCRNEFTVYEENIGICNKCLPKYNMKQFWEDHSATVKSNARGAKEMEIFFYKDRNFRDVYRIKTLLDQAKDAINENFEGVNSHKLILSIMTLCDERTKDEKIEEESFNIFKEKAKEIELTLPKGKQKAFSNFFNEMTEDVDILNWRNIIAKKAFEKISFNRKGDNIGETH